MAAVTLVPADLDPFATIDAVKAQAMIDDALAIAALVAPCILTAEFAHAGAAKAIIRGAVLRWNEAGSGALQSQTAGPFGAVVDTRQQRRGMFWPSEIEQLRDLCAGAASGVFAIDVLPAAGIVHADICSINFGATWCSCGAVYTLGLPLYENDGY